MYRTGVVCPICGNKTDQNPCEVCGYRWSDDEEEEEEENECKNTHKKDNNNN